MSDHSVIEYCFSSKKYELKILDMGRVSPITQSCSQKQILKIAYALQTDLFLSEALF